MGSSATIHEGCVQLVPSVGFHDMSCLTTQRTVRANYAMTASARGMLSNSMLLAVPA
jgi:hypothetical protein